MTHFHSILRRIKWRMTLNLVLEGGARGLFAGGMAALLTLLVDRGVESIELPLVVYAGLSIGGAIAGAIASFLKTPRASQVAAAMDSRLALKNRLATAAAIEAGAVPESEFAPLVRADAERAAQRINPRSASPLRVSHAWTAAALTLAALAAAFIYLPEFARAGTAAPAPTREQVAALAQSRSEAAATLESTLEELRDAPAAAASDEDLAALDDLAAHLRRDDISPGDFAASRNAASEKLDDLAEQLAARAERDERVLEELDRRFEGLAAREDEGEEVRDAAADLAQSLAQGEYDRAAAAADDLARDLAQMTPEERAAAADQIRRLRDQIEQSAPAAPQQSAGREESLRDLLREQGIDEEQIDELLPPGDTESQSPAAREEENHPEIGGDAENPPRQDDPPRPDPPSPREMSERLAEQGIDGEQAERIAEEIARANEESAARQEAEQIAREIARSLDQLADDAEQDAESDDAAPEDPDSEKEEKAGDQETGAQNAEQQQDARSDDAASEDRGNEGEEEGQEGEEKGQPQQSSEQDRQKREQLETQRQACPDCKPGAPCADHRDGAGTAEPVKSGQQGGRADGENAEGENQEGPQEGEPSEPRGEGEGEREQPGTSSGDGGRDQESSQERIEQILRELDERGQGAGESRRQSDQTREAAREIARQLTPEERQRLEQWASEFQKQDQSSPPSRRDDDAKAAGAAQPPGRGGDQLTQQDPLEEEFFTDSQEIDLRDDAGEQRTLAEWLADERPAEGEAGRTDRPSGGAMVSEAQRVAERAVNEGAVPRRYHDFIQRYFGRLRQTIDEAAAKDADSNE